MQKKRNNIKVKKSNQSNNLKTIDLNKFNELQNKFNKILNMMNSRNLKSSSEFIIREKICSLNLQILQKLKKE